MSTKLEEKLLEIKLLTLCKELGRIPKLNELIEHDFIKCYKEIKKYFDENNLGDWRNYCRKNGYGLETDLCIKGE